MHRRCSSFHHFFSLARVTLLLLLMFGSVRCFTAVRAPLVVRTSRNRNRRHGASLLSRHLASTSRAPGIDIYDEQDDLPGVDKDRLYDTIDRIRKLIGHETYGVALVLVDDEAMQHANRESRNVDAATDILSFPFHEAKSPGVLEPPEFDLPDFYTLGDMFVDIPYVMRRCSEDYQEPGEEDDDDEDRGVSAAMAKVFDPEMRIHMLLVHGMLHLVGYDHNDDDEYELMVTKEEEILKELDLPGSIAKSQSPSLPAR